MGTVTIGVALGSVMPKPVSGDGFWIDPVVSLSMMPLLEPGAAPELNSLARLDPSPTGAVALDC